MNSKQFTDRLYKLVSHKPWALIYVIAAITLFFLFGSFKLEMNPSLKSMVPKQHRFMETMDEIDDLFGGSTIIVLAVESDSLLYQNTLNKFLAYNDSLANIDVIQNIISLYSASRIVNSEEGFEIVPLINFFPHSNPYIFAVGPPTSRI